MFICRVTGTIVATRKAPQFSKAKLLVVHPVDEHGELSGRQDYLALDPRFGAGVNDYVLVAREGAVVKQLMGPEPAPANVIILGVIDSWQTSG